MLRNYTAGRKFRDCETMLIYENHSQIFCDMTSIPECRFFHHVSGLDVPEGHVTCFTLSITNTHLS